MGQRHPDTEWKVADLVEHLIEEHRWAAPLMHGQDLESAAKVVEDPDRCRSTVAWARTSHRSGTTP